MIKFSETLLHEVLSFPGAQWENSNGYTFVLKIPIIIVLVLIRLPIAIVLDFLFASLDLKD